MTENQIWWFGDTLINSPLVSEENKIDRPVGSKCPECAKKISERDRGVVTICNDGEWGTWQLAWNGRHQRVISYHLTCWFAIVENGTIEGTRVEERMRGAITDTWVGDSYSQGDIEIPEDPADLPATERHEPGKGWKR